MDKDEARRREEAIAWFAARRAGAMLADRRDAYDAWRADPLNQAALDAVHEKWGELSALKELDPGRRPSLVAKPVYAIAAAAVVAAFALAAVWTQMQSGRVIETAIGQQKTQSLPDGSVVAVNVVSKVSYDIDDRKRIVKLDDGEAAFTVHHDRDRPFSVVAGDYEVRAIGTAFNVRQRAGVIEVSVSEGEVQVCALSGPRAGEVMSHLKAGQALSFSRILDAGTSLSEPRRVPLETVAEWRSRAVSYEDASVGEVVEDFNRYFARKLIIDDDRLRERRVTVRLQVEDRDRAIKTLAVLLDGRVRSSGDIDRLEE